MVSWERHHAYSETTHIFQAHLHQIAPKVLEAKKHGLTIWLCDCSDLVFTPQQAVVVVFDAGADEVHAVVLDSKVKISKPEHHPGGGETGDKSKRHSVNKWI